VCPSTSHRCFEDVDVPRDEDVPTDKFNGADVNGDSAIVDVNGSDVDVADEDLECTKAEEAAGVDTKAGGGDLLLMGISNLEYL